MHRFAASVQRNLIMCSGLVACMLLNACCCQGGRGYWQPPADETQQLPYHVDGAYDATIIAFQKKFRSQGIGFVTIGQNYLVSIPSALLFPDQSPRILWPSYAVLNDVSAYLKQFRIVSVHIIAYSSKYKSVRREHALTLARARAVGDYLWSQGVDTRFIFTEGAGSDKPILAQESGSDNSPNARVEITFRNAII